MIDETPISVNPFFKSIQEFEPPDGSDEVVVDYTSFLLSNAMFAVAHEVALLRKTHEKGIRDLNNNLSALLGAVGRLR